MVTPLINRDELDHAGTHRLIEHMLSGGVHGLFALGTTGEAPSLSYHLRRSMIDLVCQTVDRRVPVLVGITDTSFVESIALARHAADRGAAAVVLATPYYFPAGQTELIQYVRRLVEELPLPLMLYNMPALTKVWFEIETLRQLSELPQIVGVKDSSGDLEYYRQVVELKQTRPDWSVMIGPEHLLVQSLELGGDGGVHGGANCYPELFAGLYGAAKRGDQQEVERRSKIVQRLQAIYDVGKYASRHIKATKCALSLLDVCSDHMAEPFNHFLAPERQRVAEILDELDVK